MTCIVGIVDKKSKAVIIGGDSAGVNGYDLQIRKDAKVFKVGNFIIGGTSSFRMIQILRFSFTPPEINKKDIYEYMCTDFINSVRDVFKENGFLQKYSSDDDKGGSFLVGYKNRLFKVEDDFQVAESLNGYDAIGCGSSYALGALKILIDNNKHRIVLTTKEIIFKSLECSSYFSSGVIAPFKILTT